VEQASVAGLHVRPYDPGVDNARLLSFLGGLSARSGYVPGFNFGEVSWIGSRVLDPSFASGVALVTGAGDVIRGAVWLEPNTEFAFTLEPELASDRSVLEGLVRYAIAEASRFVPGATEPVISCCLRGDPVLASAFQAAGMTSDQTVVYHSYCRDLTRGVEPHGLPDGHSYRSITEEHQIPERTAVLLSVWPSATVDVENYRRVRGASLYRPDLDVVVDAGDGHYAAFCLGWFDAEHRVGQFEPIGVREGYRNKGLGKAIVLEGCRRMKEAGASKVYLNCHADNTAGSALYRSAGFDLVGEWVRWSVSTG
jgi:GNAT superfamily N-acetyltransferase